MIKCGRCHAQHATANDVRACYGVQGTATATTTIDRPAKAQGGDWYHRPATEKQLAFLRDLVANREDSGGAHDEAIMHLLEGKPLSKDEAGAAITALLGMPKKAGRTGNRSGSNLPNVPAGHYAIDTDDGLRFYRVDRPTEGRWAGYTFVQVQASDDHYPVRGQQAKTVLAKIAEDPQGAMLRYGKEIGRCGHCGRTLTNEESRERGIGPVCWAKMGW